MRHEGSAALGREKLKPDGGGGGGVRELPRACRLAVFRLQVETSN